MTDYHNRLRRRFLRKLAATKPLQFWHWGDIDLGGFRVFAHLCRQTGLNLQPLLMDVETYRRHLEYGMEVSEPYIKQLKRLQSDPEYQVFWPVIADMVNRRKRLEQEAVGFVWPPHRSDHSGMRSYGSVRARG